MAWWVPLIAMAASAAAKQKANDEAKSASDKAMKKADDMRTRGMDIYSSIDPQMLEGLSTSFFDSMIDPYDPTRGYSPEMFQMIDSPDVIPYEYVGDAGATMVDDSPEARAMQMTALNQLASRAEEGLDAESQADYMKARREAGEMAAGREGAITQNLQARGMGGTGIEAALRMLASQGATNNFSELMAMEAAENAQQRALGEEMRFRAAGDLRGQDISLNRSNADILNQFAMENSARRQQIKNANTASRNQTQRDNTAYQRSVAEGNVGLRNKAQAQNLERDVSRRTAANDRTYQRGMLDNQNFRSLYDAKKEDAANQAKMATEGLSDIYAKGAQDAQQKRAMWDAISGAAGAFGSYYGSGS